MGDRGIMEVCAALRYLNIEYTRHNLIPLIAIRLGYRGFIQL